MSNYTTEDVTSYFDTPLTPSQVAGVLTYLNEGKVPPADPCLSCEPNYIRKLISAVQAEERKNGAFPRVQTTKVLELKNEFVPASEDRPVVSENSTDPEEAEPKPKSRKGK